nr:MAG TPA: hypothetical protein [Bacteriophage sp.]
MSKIQPTFQRQKRASAHFLLKLWAIWGVW